MRKPETAGFRTRAIGLGARVGPVGRTEGIVHIEVAQRGKPLGERWIVLLLAGIEAGVLRHRHPTAGEPLGDRDGLRRCRIGQKGDRSPEQLLQRPHHGLHGILGVRALLGRPR